MIETIRRHIEGKSVAILGFGREGRSTLPWILRAGGATRIAVLDLNEISVPEDMTNMYSGEIEVITGVNYQKCLNDFDVIFKSPGIVLEEEKEHYTCKLLSEMDIFFERFKNQIIGITGTKGKSTTTTLMHHVLKNASKNVLIAGNIGIPVFDIVKDIENDTILVVELSCHQLEYASISPHIGVLLNIHEEHLDHYGTYDKYIRAKENIYRNQVAGDVIYCQKLLQPEAGDMEVVTVSARDICNDSSADIFVEGDTIHMGDEVYQIPVDEIELMGNHNYYDMAFVYGICRSLGLSVSQIEDGFKTYTPLPHRLQKIGIVDGVTYYDDSISTIDATTIQALNTLKNADTVIIGGMDRGISYETLEEYLSESDIAHIILMEETGKRIYDEIKEKYPEFRDLDRIILVSHLEEAVEVAKRVTSRGKSCVMSPAAASYGIFKNFEHRGQEFKRLVKGE